jgi:predicted CXXCH cytochrome family protein
MAIPPDWPLDSFGRLSCTTCHAVHSRENPNRLRVADEMEHFCIHCHADMPTGIDLHKRQGVSAHLRPDFRAEDAASGLDDISRSCIACHDAVIGRGAGVSYLGDGVWDHGRSIGVTHPVGVLYKEAESRDPGGFNPQGSLPEEVRLYDGRVGCATCHSPYSDRKDQLVTTNSGSRMCLACHRK